MQNTRDSSVLRSLAVAFGDGLAYGVGLKLSHRAARASGPVAAPRGDLAALIERVAEIEKRVTESGRGATRAIAVGGGQFDQKVLEAVVTALDARLNEQAVHTESRITQLEARLAIELKSLDQPGDSSGVAAEKRMDELTAHFEGQIEALRRQADEDREAQSAERVLREFENRLTVELQSLRERDQSLETLVEKRADELRANFDIEVAAIRRQADEDRRAIRSEMIAMHRQFAEEAARAVERRIDEVVGRHAAALRAELEHRVETMARSFRRKETLETMRSPS